MTWALWRSSIAVRLSPVLALVATLDNTSRRGLGDSYLLNRLLELNFFVLLFGTGLAGALAAADAGALRRRPGLRQVRLSSTRATATILASDVVATWTAVVGAYVLALLPLCLTADRGSYGWGEAALSLSVVAGLALAVEMGQLVGWLLPRHLSPIVAGALPYVFYFFAVTANDGLGVPRSLMIGDSWAPSVVPDGPRLLLASGGTTAAATVLFLTTTQLARRGSWRPLMGAGAVLVVLTAALAIVPNATKDAYYARASEQAPRCTSADSLTLCVLPADADLLPALTDAVTRYLDANGDVPGTPSAVSEVGLPEDPQTWSVGSDALLHGSGRIVGELALQHVGSPTTCPTELPTPDGVNAPWSWLVADLLAEQAGAVPDIDTPPALARLSRQELRDWLREATMRLQNCQAPTMP